MVPTTENSEGSILGPCGAAGDGSINKVEIFVFQFFVQRLCHRWFDGGVIDEDRAWLCIGSHFSNHFGDVLASPHAGENEISVFGDFF